MKGKQGGGTFLSYVWVGRCRTWHGADASTVYLNRNKHPNLSLQQKSIDSAYFFQTFYPFIFYGRHTGANLRQYFISVSRPKNKSHV